MRGLPVYAGSEAAVRFSSNCGAKECEFVAILCLHGEADGRLLVVQTL